MDKDKNILYIGRSNRGKKRIKQHIKDGYYLKHPWKNKIQFYSLYKAKSEADIMVLEPYFINKLKPEYNTTDKRDDNLNLSLDGLDVNFYAPKHVLSLEINVNREKVITKEAQHEYGYYEFESLKAVKKRKRKKYEGLSEKEFLREINKR